MHNAYMAKTATVTVRIPEALKENLEARALREHRSLSAQIEHELTQTVAGERAPGLAKAGTLLGRFVGKKVPTDADLREARTALWKRLEHDR
jgi:plasmid stability protein